jgi:phosphoribosylformylglycinamidine synthase
MTVPPTHPRFFSPLVPLHQIARLEAAAKAEKAEQGKAVAGALQRSGNKDIKGVRIGKRIELHFDREITDADLANARKIGDEFLSNAVIEDVVNVTVEN